MPESNVLARIAVTYEEQSAAILPKLAQRGYGWATFQLLLTLHNHARGLVQADVARRLGITPPTLSEAIQLHVRKGLIEQVADKRDQRAKRILLTPAGRAAIRLMLKDIDAVEQQMLKGITETELAIVVRVLDRITANLAGSEE